MDRDSFDELLNSVKQMDAIVKDKKKASCNLAFLAQTNGMDRGSCSVAWFKKI